MRLKSAIKKLTPGWLLTIYHWKLAWLGAIRYGFPSAKLIVIGITGTNGKSTTVNFLAKILRQAGHRVGFVTTANVNDGRQEWLNKWKLTMPGRWTLQKLLRQMVNHGCEYAIIETSSEGLIQHRQAAINFDLALFTNLTPEHLERHGGFDNYRLAKGRLFKHLTRWPHKKIGGRIISKIIVANGDDQFSDYFLSFAADQRVAFGFNSQRLAVVQKNLAAAGLTTAEFILAHNLQVQDWSSSFTVGQQGVAVNLAGQFNAYNALAALAAAQALGQPAAQAAMGIAQLTSMPGRMEKIDAGQPFTVIVDYAPEPASMRQLYEAVANLTPRMIIHVLGSAGGGRDQARRPILGRLAAERSGVVIVTNEDPYDEDPQLIIDQVAAGAAAVSQAEVIKILDRRQAIHEALTLARSGDLVLVTGKSCEQWICWANGRKQPWDDRAVVRDELQKLGYG